jgi:phosphonate transport system permease protein
MEPREEGGVGAAPRQTPRIPPEQPTKLSAFNVTLVLFLVAVVFSLPALRGSGRKLNYWENVISFLTRFFPPDFSDLSEIAPALIETVQMAVVATLIATLISLPIAIAASSSIAPRPVVAAARFFLACVRSIPGLVWALLAVAIFGANSLAGVIGLAIYSLGYLGKFFSDAFESVELGVGEALRAGGADLVQGFQYGIWPHAKPLVWSQTLWMLEYNIRSATIIGYVGAGGIGVWLHTYQELAQWSKFCTVLVCILAVVLILDFAGEKIRKQFAI